MDFIAIDAMIKPNRSQTKRLLKPKNFKETHKRNACGTKYKIKFNFQLNQKYE